MRQFALLTEQRVHLIVSVDDFGIRDSATPILRLAQAGKLDRVAVLIQYLEQGHLAEALLRTGVKIDLHLELIRLLGSGEKVRDGALRRSLNFMWRYMHDQLTPEAVERVWREQIEAFRRRFGRLPDGLNSHEHVHFFPPFFEVFLKLGREYKIDFMRYPCHGLIVNRFSVAGLILKILWRRDQGRHTREQAHTADWFASYDWLKNGGEFFQHLPEEKTEILFHPERPEEYAAIEKYL